MSPALVFPAGAAPGPQGCSGRCPQGCAAPGSVTSRWQLEIAEGNLGGLCSLEHSPRILGDLGTDSVSPRSRDGTFLLPTPSWEDAQEPQQTDKRGKTHGLSFLTLETEFLKSNYQFTGHISPPFTPGSTSPATESFSCHFLTQSHHRLAHAGQASPQKHFRQS